MKIHSLSSIFPKLDDVSFKALKQDIYANGLRNPIIIKNNEVIDGQNRLRACEELGIEPTFQEYEGDDLVEFVLAQNLHRRHLTAGQSATIVALAQDWSLAHQIGKKPKSNIINDLQQESYSAILPIKGLPLDAKVDTQADRAEKNKITLLKLSELHKTQATIGANRNKVDVMFRCSVKLMHDVLTNQFRF